MAEVKTALKRLEPGEIFVADDDGAYVITEQHTHSDILRFVIADYGDISHIAKIVSDEKNAASK